MKQGWVCAMSFACDSDAYANQGAKLGLLAAAAGRALQVAIE
jgi:hypothetical protein